MAGGAGLPDRRQLPGGMEQLGNRMQALPPQGAIPRAPFNPQQYANPSYAAPRPVNNYQPTLSFQDFVNRLNAGAAAPAAAAPPAAPAQPSEIDLLRAQLQAMQGGSSNGDWSGK